MQNRRFYRARDLVGTAATRRNGDRGMMPFAPTKLWKMVAEGTFPAPVKIDGITAWPADQVDSWIAAHSGSEQAAA